MIRHIWGGIGYANQNASSTPETAPREPPPSTAAAAALNQPSVGAGGSPAARGDVEDRGHFSSVPSPRNASEDSAAAAGADVPVAGFTGAGSECPSAPGKRNPKTENGTVSGTVDDTANGHRTNRSRSQQNRINRSVRNPDDFAKTVLSAGVTTAAAACAVPPAPMSSSFIDLGLGSGSTRNCSRADSGGVSKYGKGGNSSSRTRRGERGGGRVPGRIGHKEEEEVEVEEEEEEAEREDTDGIGVDSAEMETSWEVKYERVVEQYQVRVAYVITTYICVYRR